MGIYFDAPDGTRYRVFDMAWRDGEIVVADPPLPWAATRLFRPPQGEVRFYPLAFLELHPEWSREPTPEMLAILFAHSEPGGKASERTLGEGPNQRGS